MNSRRFLIVSALRDAVSDSLGSPIVRNPRRAHARSEGAIRWLREVKQFAAGQGNRNVKRTLLIEIGVLVRTADEDEADAAADAAMVELFAATISALDTLRPEYGFVVRETEQDFDAEPVDGEGAVVITRLELEYAGRATDLTQ